MIHSFISPFKQQIAGKLFTFLGAHVYYNADNALLISREHGTTMLLDRGLLEELWDREPSEGLCLKLVQRAFAAYANSRPVSRIEEKFCPVFFMIDLTKCCCLACRYCFRDLEDHGEISDKVLDDICFFILRHCRDNKMTAVNIQAWGGEPLLAFDKIERIYRNFENTGVKATICIETNGVPLNQEVVAKLENMRARVGISIDGIPCLHNEHRPLVSGRGSMPEVLDGLRHLHASGYLHNHQGICVVTKKSLDKVRDIVDYFADTLDLNLFKFGIVKPNPQMKEAGLELSVCDVEFFADQMFDAVIDKIRRGKRIIEHNIRSRAVNLLTRKASDICLSRGCMGGRKMVAIDQEGKIFTCELMDLKGEAFGSIYSDKSLNEQIESALLEHTYFKSKYSLACETCPWHFFCRGGCTSSIRYQDGCYSGRIDKVTCAMNRVLYEKLVDIILTDSELAQQLVVNDDNNTL